MKDWTMDLQPADQADLAPPTRSNKGGPKYGSTEVYRRRDENAQYLAGRRKAKLEAEGVLTADDVDDLPHAWGRR